ncbi:MAG: OmpA family protein [Actinomycetota bacterium]
MEPTGPGGAEDEEKLIPEWRVGADDQIIWAGLAVFAAMLLLLGWDWWRGRDDDGSILATPLTSIIADDDGVAGDGDGDGSGVVAAPVITEAPATTTTTEAPATTTTEAPTTTTEVQIGDVNAAVAGLAGAIAGSNDDTTAVLEGFVANQGESDAAEAAAAAVEGIESVDNRLELLEPAVLSVLTDANVADAGVTGEGTVITLTGMLQSEDDRAATVAAAEAVDGVTEVIDELEVSVVADLNALPQVQFAYNSAEILPESQADLDEAAAMIIEAGDVALRVEGYTDIEGDAADNQLLSEARANAVRDYLIGAGVDAEALTAEGFGETEKFAEGADEAARAENRRVVFMDLG